MKILVCGSRDWSNRRVIKQALLKLPKEGTIIVHGGATGADSIADDIARKAGFEVRVYPVTEEDWAEHGKSAGPRRNSHMIRMEHSDKQGVPINLVLAFTPNLDRSRGTKDMVQKARKAGIKVEVIGVDQPTSVEGA